MLRAVVVNRLPGTGFRPPETGAPNRDLETISLRRDRKSETTTREKWPQKRFLLACYQLRVSEDWVVADAVRCERVSKANNREFFEYFGPKQASAELMAVRYSKFDSDSS